MTGKWTKRPWKVNERDETAVDAGHYQFRHHWMGVGSANEMQANAHLISAAPDLAEALEELLETNDGGTIDQQARAFDKARAALHKANGETE